VTEASRLARASGDAALQHRVVRLAAELSLRQGAGAASVVPTLRALVRRSQRARDTYGEARDRLVLARALALHRPQAAPAEAMVALRLAEAGGYRRLAARAARLATLLGAADAARSPRLGDPPRTFEDRVLAAAAGVAATDSAGDLSAALAAWEAALEAAPSPARSPLDALCSRAFEGAGLVREGRGTAPALLFDDRDRTVGRDGVRIAAFGRGGLPYRLLLAVAAPGTRPPGREALFRAVWEQPYRPPSSDRALFTTAGRIRERLSPAPPAPSPPTPTRWERRRPPP
ncbi:hypothetical protein L6R50_14000, partial [Myxococcota bacterium]|nr:hypothetical protein [Myxococcota bacterium]